MPMIRPTVIWHQQKDADGQPPRPGYRVVLDLEAGDMLIQGRWPMAEHSPNFPRHPPHPWARAIEQAYFASGKAQTWCHPRGEPIEVRECARYQCATCPHFPAHSPAATTAGTPGGA